MRITRSGDLVGHRPDRSPFEHHIATAFYWPNIADQYWEAETAMWRFKGGE